MECVERVKRRHGRSIHLPKLFKNRILALRKKTQLWISTLRSVFPPCDSRHADLIELSLFQIAQDFFGA